MRKTLFAAAALAAATAIATPALAGEARVEVHTGLGWDDSLPSKGEIGAAVGYDFNLAPSTFVGVEHSIDKTLISSKDARWGTTARAGVNVPAVGKLYALAGYSYGVGPNATHVGGGLEHSFGPAFGKVEYRHYFTEDGAPDTNAALVGVGVHF